MEREGEGERWRRRGRGRGRLTFTPMGYAIWGGSAPPNWSKSEKTIFSFLHQSPRFPKESCHFFFFSCHFRSNNFMPDCHFFLRQSTEKCPQGGRFGARIGIATAVFFICKSLRYNFFLRRLTFLPWAAQVGPPRCGASLRQRATKGRRRAQQQKIDSQHFMFIFNIVDTHRRLR